MSSFNRVDIDKLKINWDEIYTNKSDAQNSTNNITANQEYWGDEEGLSAEIQDDGTVLIYEGDTPMGWTTLEALGLDETGNELKIDFSDLSPEDIEDGQYVECEKDGTEGYAIKDANGNIQFFEKDWFATSQNGVGLYQNGTEYIMIDTNSQEVKTGLTLNDLQNYAGQNGAMVFDDPRGYKTLLTAGGITNYGENDQFTLGNEDYLIGENGIIQINEDGSVSVVDKVTTPSGTEIDADLIRGTAEYEGEKVLIVGSEGETGQAMIISEDGSNELVSRSEFPEFFKEQTQDSNADTTKAETTNESSTTTSSGKNALEKSVKVDENTTAKYDNNGELVEFTNGSKTYEKTTTGYQTTITSQSGENYNMRYDNNGNFRDVIDSEGNKVIYKDDLGQIKGYPIDDRYMSFSGINDIINNCKQANNM